MSEGFTAKNAGFLEAVNLGDGLFQLVGVGRGHRLHPDRVVAADDHIADRDLAGLMPVEGVLISHAKLQGNGPQREPGASVRSSVILVCGAGTRQGRDGRKT